MISAFGIVHEIGKVDARDQRDPHSPVVRRKRRRLVLRTPHDEPWAGSGPRATLNHQAMDMAGDRRSRAEREHFADVGSSYDHAELRRRAAGRRKPPTKPVRKSAFGIEHDEIAKAEARRKAKHALRERAETALHPPPVPLHPAKSSFITATGYQKPTRRLALQMRSRPDQPYVYRASPRQAAAFERAPSLGRHYAEHVRGQYRRPTRYTVADRARLFAAGPQKENS